MAALSVAEKVPFISPVARLLLLALAMRGEVKRYKQEWDVVMIKVEQVADLVITLERFARNITWKRKIFRELDGIKTALTQCKEIGRVKQVLSRRDLLLKVKHYDSMLSNVLQRLQLTLTLDARFAQLAYQKEQRANRSTPPVLVVLASRTFRAACRTFVSIATGVEIKGHSQTLIHSPTMLSLATFTMSHTDLQVERERIIKVDKTLDSECSQSETNTKATARTALLNPASSQPIGGAGDTAMGAIEASLAALSAASALAAKVPFISPVAGLLLQALTMRNEVKQHKEEWDIVMVKLEQVADIVDTVGTLCEKHNLEEKDLPLACMGSFSPLRRMLYILNIPNCGSFALKQSKEIGSFKQVLLRKDLLLKVKQYDGMLSNVLQRFQVTLALDARFAQIADQKGHKVTQGAPPGLSGSSGIAILMPRGPRSPQIFFGRDSELSEIIHMIFTHVNSRPARIAILGPGGYGKTTLANAVLTHQRVREHFGDARYFVACESVFSAGALLIELAKTLGLWTRPQMPLGLDCIVCLDNFESLWDQDGDMRYAVEELLSRIAELRHITLLITMRGTVRPAQTQWTSPLLHPLVTLDRDAARRVWEQITNHYDAFAEELIKAVDYVPLAVSLLAHLAQATSAELLLKEWNEKRTKFVHTSQTNKQSNLDYSIQLSIDSGRMRANPSAKDMLGVLSMLPDGIHLKQMDKFKKILCNIDFLSGLRTLQECSLIGVVGERYQTIQSFVTFVTIMT
ncbi:hypothetical protein BJV77DRAFT_963347 [Russula vinacea]|nr:hypothetical protein BJV77DRAFT_963347 [Russula vinacea]